MCGQMYNPYIYLQKRLESYRTNSNLTPVTRSSEEVLEPTGSLQGFANSIYSITGVSLEGFPQSINRSIENQYYITEK